MGKRGPPPVPSELKKLRGTYRSDRVAKNEPKPEVRTPSCPEWLPAAARAEWNRVSKELRTLGLLSRIDRAALIAYCAAYAEFRQMEEILQEKGHTQVAESGYESQRPEVAIRNRAADRMKQFMKEFGMTPAARTRIDVAPPRPEDPGDSDGGRDNEFDRFREKKKVG